MQWVVDSPLRGDKFPIVLFSKLALNVTVKTTWGPVQRFALKPAGYNQANVAWVKLPGTSLGNGSVSVFINDELQGSYPLDWAELPAMPTFPARVAYSYRWHSVWSGATVLKVNLWANGTMQVANMILRRSHPDAELGLYNTPFDFVQHGAITDWAGFWQAIDFSEAHKWQVWEYHTPVSLCDGGGYEERGVLYWGDNAQYQLSVTEVRDDDTCHGGRTLHSHPEISQVFDLLLNFTQELISRHFRSESPQATIDYPSFAGLLALPILSGAIILKKRNKKR